MNKKATIILVSVLLIGGGVAIVVYNKNKKRDALNANSAVNDIYAYFVAQAKPQFKTDIINSEEAIKTALLKLPKDELNTLKQQVIIIKQFNDMKVTMSTPTYIDQQSFEVYKNYEGLFERALKKISLNDFLNKINI